jgi:Protein of unknown function (DUF2971)
VIPSKLYKYGNAERLDVLQHKRIRFTQGSAQNDPFELMATVDALASTTDLHAEVMKDVDRKLREEYKSTPQLRARFSFSEFVRNTKGSPQFVHLVDATRALTEAAFAKMRHDLTVVLQRDFGILSLAEECDNDAMWAHYADSHRGLVFEFDSEHSWFSRKGSLAGDLYCLHRVDYVDLVRSGKSLRELGGEVIYTKRPVWSYEREWRVVAPVKDASDVVNRDGELIYLFDVAPSAIRAVILGARSSVDLQAKVLACVGTEPSLAHVAVHRARIDFVRGAITLDAVN